nr:hypothetical protein Iba_chr11dCG5120 [Ipomoea batatas]
MVAIVCFALADFRLQQWEESPVVPKSWFLPSSLVTSPPLTVNTGLIQDFWFDIVEIEVFAQIQCRKGVDVPEFETAEPGDIKRLPGLPGHCCAASGGGVKQAVDGSVGPIAKAEAVTPGENALIDNAVRESNPAGDWAAEGGSDWRKDAGEEGGAMKVKDITSQFQMGLKTERENVDKVSIENLFLDVAAYFLSFPPQSPNSIPFQSKKHAVQFQLEED